MHLNIVFVLIALYPFIFSLVSSSLEGGAPKTDSSDSSQIQPDLTVLDSCIIELSIDCSPPPICSFVCSPTCLLSPASQSVAHSSSAWVDSQSASLLGILVAHLLQTVSTYQSQVNQCHHILHYQWCFVLGCSGILLQSHHVHINGQVHSAMPFFQSCMIFAHLPSCVHSSPHSLFLTAC